MPFFVILIEKFLARRRIRFIDRVLDRQTARSAEILRAERQELLNKLGLV